MPVGENARYESKVHEGVVVVATQEAQELVVVQGLIRDMKPAVMIELGTFMGGLTLAIHEAAPETPLYTFDRTVAIAGEYVTTHPSGSHHYRREWYGPTVVFCHADILDREIPGRLREALNLPGRKLLLCDDGSKVREVRRYAPLLRPGDIIGTHDWPHEIKAADVEDALREFRPLLWDECEGAWPPVSWRFWERE